MLLRIKIGDINPVCRKVWHKCWPLTLLFFLFLISCKGPYTPTDTESKIMDETFLHLKMINLKKVNECAKIKDEIWSLIFRTGYKHHSIGNDVEEDYNHLQLATHKIDSLSQRVASGQSNQLDIGFLNKMNKQRHLRYFTTKKDTFSVYSILKQLRPNTKLTEKSTLEEITTELFSNHNQKLVLEIVKSKTIDFYTDLMLERSYFIGTFCYQGPRLSSSLIVNESNHKEVPYEPVLLLIDHQTVDQLSYESYQMDGKTLKRTHPNQSAANSQPIKRSQLFYGFEIPTTGVVPGEKRFTVICSTHWGPKEIQSTVPGMYFVTK